MAIKRVAFVAMAAVLLTGLGASAVAKYGANTNVVTSVKKG